MRFHNFTFFNNEVGARFVDRMNPYLQYAQIAADNAFFALELPVSEYNVKFNRANEQQRKRMTLEIAQNDYDKYLSMIETNNVDFHNESVNDTQKARYNPASTFEAIGNPHFSANTKQDSILQHLVKEKDLARRMTRSLTDPEATKFRPSLLDNPTVHFQSQPADMVPEGSKLNVEMKMLAERLAKIKHSGSSAQSGQFGIETAHAQSNFPQQSENQGNYYNNFPNAASFSKVRNTRDSEYVFKGTNSRDEYIESDKEDDDY